MKHLASVLGYKEVVPTLHLDRPALPELLVAVGELDISIGLTLQIVVVALRSNHILVVAYMLQLDPLPRLAILVGTVHVSAWRRTLQVVVVARVATQVDRAASRDVGLALRGSVVVVQLPRLPAKPVGVVTTHSPVAAYQPTYSSTHAQTKETRSVQHRLRYRTRHLDE